MDPITKMRSVGKKLVIGFAYLRKVEVTLSGTKCKKGAKNQQF